MRTRLEVTNITTDIAGEQPFTLDAHLSTSSDRRHRPADVVTLALGGLLFYCYDRASIRAFATVWTDVCELATASRALPELADFAVGPGWDRHHASVILRVLGSPARTSSNVIPSGASPTGIPHAAVTLDRFTVHAYDLLSMRSWADGWASADATADRIWPTPDAFDEAENRERRRIARTGKPSKAGGAPRSS